MMVKTSSSLCLHLLILVVFGAHCGHCGIYNSPGETQPPRVEIKINSSANITCRMNLTKFGGNVNSSSLYFVEEDTGRIVPVTEIEILNSTTIVFMLRNAVEQDRNYICKSGKMGIGVTHVSVGTAPLDVTDFKCRGYDYTYMVCSFSIPDNVILTQYNLSYTAQSALYQISVKGKDGKSHNRTVYSQNYIQICPLEVQQNQAICNLTQGNYRENYEFFNFTLTGRNDVGTNVQSFWINNYESVIPPRPEYIFEKTTNNSVVIKWHNIKYSYYTAKGLQYEIRLRPRNRGVDWMNHSNYEIRNNRSEQKIIVRNIPFAHFWYELSLRVRVKKAARNDDSYWSEAYIQEFQTAACAPETAPLTDVGSFYIDPTETKIRLYWRQLPEYKENGPDFQYLIKQVEIDGVEVSLPPLLIDRTSAVFNWDRERRYKFVIKSRNAMGESPDNSTIIVPAMPKQHERSMSPKWIRNVYHANNITYTLSWNPPNRKEGLVDYTVFWCQSKRATPNECDDTIFFTHVARNTTRFNSSPQKQEQSLNLAVSANYREFNTGMHWTMCTADVTSDLAKMEPEIISTSARSIVVQWSSDRVCSSLLEGYNLTYCRLIPRPILHAENVSCLDEPITVTIPNTAKKYEIKGLKPFSTYKVEMLVFSKLKNGKMSDAQYVNTTEEAPSKPLHLKAVNITSNSAILTWVAPEHRNGILRKYRIEYNNEHHVIDCLLDESVCSPKLMKFKLENLSSYTRYKVYVVAYTTSASKHSNDINVETLVGIPSNPRHIKTKENSHNILQWSRPEVPSGRVEFYQVAIIVWYKDLIQRQHISNVIGATQCEFHLPVCIDADYRFTMQVRAVNMANRDFEIDHYIYATKNATSDSADILRDSDNSAENEDLKCVQTNLDVNLIQEYRNSKKYVQYTSVWEKGPVTNCSDTKMSRITMVALLVVVSSLGVMAAFYVARNKYLKMANISCALPPGLEAMAYPTKDNGDEGDFRRSKESFYNNESRHLLSSISHDSGYICNNGDNRNIGDAGIDGITPNSIGKSSGYSGSDHSTEYCNADTISDNGCIVHRTPTLDDAYMVMELLSPSENKLKQPTLSASKYAQLLPQSDKCGYVEHNFIGIPALSGNKNTQMLPSFMPTENGYIKQMPTANAAQMIPSQNGYIKPHNIFNWSTQNIPHISTAVTAPTTTTSAYVDNNALENSTGYVGPHLMHKPLLQPVSNGYISLAALNKSVDPDQRTVSQTLLQSDGGDRESVPSMIPPISGYVTQKELSAYAQQQQIN